jgi:hypothetical protein
LQLYFDKNGDTNSYCRAIVKPKVHKAETKFKELMK